LRQIRFEAIDLTLQIQQRTAQLGSGLVLGLGLRLGVLLDQGTRGVLGLLQTLAQIKDGTARFIVSAKQSRLRWAGQACQP
jgi:hypothetical protein